ncbi:MAG: thiaminase II [Candidatus Binatus sp.]|uniref:thiaminase II n=1 Tax=Candidatus Binatus sp. TaxID=2811406 RepID=UPI002722E113|nr:thiaminase II [Candidatus Binatus sp.]MDO8434243.1 thiaminase II [Candidatus Binatus sp.]
MTTRNSFTQAIRAKAQPIWDRELQHPFVRGLGDGTLSLDRFRFYLAQDYVFLIEYGRVFALAAAKARDLGTIGFFAKLLDETLNTEMRLHRDYCRRLGIAEAELEATTPAPITHAYTRHLLTVAYSGSLVEIVAAVIPCQLGYAEIGTALARENCGRENANYSEWIDMYSSPEFLAGAEKLGTLLDDLTAGLPARELALLETLFLTSSRYEYLFWEMAWTQASWPV